ncbi:unnamed protein product [Paramecium sonneborni]|uniref:Aspartyl-tRNA synthetase n=1 Tax=Paramecium sonneborni TaxID=65129 RepID=A0A8S1N1R2_9CILI|nr:unnamed protein product [Paramecium sonneborni]
MQDQQPEQPVQPEQKVQPEQQVQAVVAEGEKKSKKQQQREKKEEEKAKKKQQGQQGDHPVGGQQVQEADNCVGKYGDLQMIQSQERTNRKWIKVGDVDQTLVGQVILVRSRIHNSRVKGKLAFLVLRDNYNTIQVVAEKGEFASTQMLKYISGIPLESVVDIEALVKQPHKEILSCTQKVELEVRTIKVVSRSQPMLPFQIEDASRRITDFEDGVQEIKQEEVQQKQEILQQQDKNEKQEKQQIQVMLKTRLDNRVIDLRTPAKQAIFRVQSGIGLLFREFLVENGFIEIHTPKLIGGTSEGGTNVFKLKYFNQDACLAQSPQLYKQMCLMADYDRVFEVAPVFRAENSNTHRHQCEFISMDIEMVIKEHFTELLDLMGDLCIYMFKGIEKRYQKEIEIISQQFPFEPFKIPEPVLKLTFEEGVKMLHEAGVNQDPNDDLDTTNEKTLGKLVREKYGTDFYILHRYPKKARPFYTMPCHDDPNYTLSYDFFMRGEEIVSGAQRVHDPELLIKQIKEKGIAVEPLMDYINSFRYGAYPHGGCAFGLERVAFLYFNLKNIRNACMFPRDPVRLFP